MSDGCHYCGTTERELRPYGPEGSPLCVPCVRSDPEIEAVAQANFHAQYEAAAAMSPLGAAVLSDDGPQPMTGADREG